MVEGLTNAGRVDDQNGNCFQFLIRERRKGKLTKRAVYETISALSLSPNAEIWEREGGRGEFVGNV